MIHYRNRVSPFAPFWADFFPELAVGRSAEEYPPINLYVKPDGALATALLPGVDIANIDISIKDDRLRISTERRTGDASENAQELRSERAHGKFSRSVHLPFKVDADRAEARYENGELRITLPRSEADKPRKIAVSA